MNCGVLFWWTYSLLLNLPVEFVYFSVAPNSLFYSYEVLLYNSQLHILCYEKHLKDKYTLVSQTTPHVHGELLFVMLREGRSKSQCVAGITSKVTGNHSNNTRLVSWHLWIIMWRPGAFSDLMFTNCIYMILEAWNFDQW